MSRSSGEKEFRFEVPATCANLGPGFGTLGLAVRIPLRISVRSHAEPGHVVQRVGEMSGTVDDPRHDNLLRALQACAERFDIALPVGLEIEAHSTIPAATGLGTSSAGFAAGVGVAVRFAKSPPDPDALIDLLVELGADASHGGAALYGGLVATCPVQIAKEKRSHRVFRYPLHNGWRVAVVCPKVSLATADVRRVLPASLPHAVIRRNSGRLLGLLHAFAEGDQELLRQCIVDEAHVPFRRRLVHGLDAAMRAGDEKGAAVTISGAGPALVAFARNGAMQEIYEAMAQPLRAKGLDVDAFEVTPSLHGALHTPAADPEDGDSGEGGDASETTEKGSAT